MMRRVIRTTSTTSNFLLVAVRVAALAVILIILSSATTRNHCHGFIISTPSPSSYLTTSHYSAIQQIRAAALTATSTTRISSPADSGRSSSSKRTKSRRKRRFLSSRVLLSLSDDDSSLLTTNSDDAATAAADDDTTTPVASVTFLIPSSKDISTTKRTNFGASSPVGNPSVLEAVQHLCNKLYWMSDGQINANIVPVFGNNGNNNDDDDEGTKYRNLYECDVLIAYGLGDDRQDIALAKRIFDDRRLRESQLRRRQCHFAIECYSPSPEEDNDEELLPAMVGPYDDSEGGGGSFSSLLGIFPWTTMATAKRLKQQMVDLFNRTTTDDFCTSILLFINQFISEIDWVKYSIDATWEKGPIRNALEFRDMVSKCGDCIVDCVQDEQCNECLNQLTKVDSRDQVLSYRTIVSYESDLLRDFSFCILQKNNIFKCDAKIPTLPNVSPLETWRGKPLTEDTAKALVIGHLDIEQDELPVRPNNNNDAANSLKLPVSWKVACGANVAYDQFPSQNQLFYPAAARNGRDMWYDPVFRVKTIDGRNVWCKRHYKVRPAKNAGQFHLSFLDNGVTSNEFWTIVDAADDLSWIVFHYAGAAGAVGQRYLGGLLCTPDGSLPQQSNADDGNAELSRIWESFSKRAGIQPWELYVVDNDESDSGYLDAGTPPLNYYRDQVLATRRKRNEK